MIVAENMQQPVDDEPGNFVVEAPVAAGGLARRGLHADHDIPEQFSSVKGSFALQQRKGKDIGRPLPPASCSGELSAVQ